MVVIFIAASPAHAQKSANTLRIAWRDAIDNVDPYYNQLRTGLVLAHQAWDTLVYRDPDTFQIKPLLATAWKQTDDTTWEFTLRQGVTFHDGSPFTADDVVYTINTVLADPKVAVPSNFAYLAGAEKIDELHVRVKLKRVFPAALEYMAMTLPIWPKAYRERVGPGRYSKAPVGTGPYRITQIDGASEIDLERNDAYFDGPKGHPAIANIVIHEVSDATTEITEILAGRVDWIWQFNPDQFENIARVPSLQAIRAESMRIGYLSFDAAGRTGPDNPMTKLKVRQAIAHAIDRATIARQLVQGGSRVLEAACYPTQFGCDQAVATHYDYDPALAKKLLTEAGYPDGFDTELVSYVLPQYSDAVLGYLKAVGINARLSQLPTGVVVQRALNGENPITSGSWGSYSVNDVSAILPVFFDGGGNDYSRDVDVQKLVQAGGATTDADERRKDYTAALRRISDQMYWLPLNTYVTTYAFSRQLNFKPFPDELPRFFLATWK
ncbi:ABC transporter substrate-binding protein [Acidisphaera sp. L21]|uniref:ABC transporter substrate-binding protein n=1 Tax=Acidisphaera sp. L21 TaxID=1641851 RepID=UPI0020B1445A|nr:ABC transporter substrate-binding protein [Acidisphaera sp. L21]